jgi:hypothetical protein
MRRTLGLLAFSLPIFSTAAIGATGCSTDQPSTCASTDGGCGRPSASEGPPTTQFARLTHAQWENTIADLFGTTELAELSRTFRSDPNQQGYLFDSDINSLVVDQALWQGYQATANEVAAFVVNDSAILESLTPLEVEPEQMGRAFIEMFGRRVHRRPLTDAQVEEYLTLYESGTEVFPELSPFEAGVRVLVQAFLQSPYFIYRVEGARDAGALDSYEIGSRLSYTLWDTMPDDTLLAAAEAEELSNPAVVAEQAQRLLASERARPVLRRMHSLLFDIERYRGILRYPEETLPDMAEEEHRLFVEHVLFERRGTLADLLTSTETFANSTLAELYGLEGDFGDDFRLVELDPTQRSGFLTHVGFLASNANTGVPDPIHRGVFVARRMVCLDIAMPPDNIPPLPPADGRTNRETVEAHTETPGSVCSACHSRIINPFGFPFEYYDGLGRYRTEDNGHPVDGASSPGLEGNPTVANGVELAMALASSRQVHDCYAKHLFEFTFGRLSTPSDQALIELAADRSWNDSAPIQDLLIEFVSSSAFLIRNSGSSQ